jgi:phosphatidylinositol alpha-1,6-mannosyltransferase
MKTLLITLEYPPFKGGVSDYYDHIVRCWPESGNIEALDNSGHKLEISWLRPKWLFSFFFLYRAIARKKIEHLIVGQILPPGITAYYVTKLTRTPYTVFLHGMDFTYALRTDRKKKMTAKILSRAAHIICVSNYTAELVKNFVGDKDAAKVRVVNPGIDADELRIIDYELRIKRLREKYDLHNKVVLFSVGRLVKRKGFDKVIEAMPEVVRSVSNLYYFLAGDGPDKKYIYGKAEGVPNIFFLGRIDDETKWAWLHACDIFITPARKIGDDFEGFGIVYLEAGLCGKPVIAGDSGGVRDAVKGAVSGMFVDPDNTERIAGAIINLAQDENLRKQLGERGRRRAISEFNWSKQIDKIYRIITSRNL